MDMIVLDMFIAILSSVIGAFVMLKLLKSEGKALIFELFDEIKADISKQSLNYLNSEEGQTVLWKIGGIVANGAKQGFGLQKGGGKRGLKGMVLELLGGVIEKRLMKPGQNPAGIAHGAKDNLLSSA